MKTPVYKFILGAGVFFIKLGVVLSSYAALKMAFRGSVFMRKVYCFFFLLFAVCSVVVAAPYWQGTVVINNLSPYTSWTAATCPPISLVCYQYNCSGVLFNQVGSTNVGLSVPTILPDGTQTTSIGACYLSGNGFTCSGSVSRLSLYYNGVLEQSVDQQTAPGMVPQTVNWSLNVMGCVDASTNCFVTNTITLNNSDVFTHSYVYGSDPITLPGASSPSSFAGQSVNCILQPGQSQTLTLISTCVNAQGGVGVLDTQMAAGNQTQATNGNPPNYQQGTNGLSGGGTNAWTSTMNGGASNVPVYQGSTGGTNSPSGIVWGGAASTNLNAITQQGLGALYTLTANEDSLLLAGQGAGFSNVVGSLGNLSNLLTHLGSGGGTNIYVVSGSTNIFDMGTNLNLQITQVGISNLLNAISTNGGKGLSSNQWMEIVGSQGPVFGGGVLSGTNTDTLLALSTSQLGVFQSGVDSLIAAVPDVPVSEGPGDLFSGLDVEAGVHPGEHTFHISMLGNGFDQLYVVVYKLFTWLLCITYAGFIVNYIWKMCGWLMGFKGFECPNVDVAGFNVGAVAYPALVAALGILWAAYLAIILDSVGSGGIDWVGILSHVTTSPIASMDTGAFAFLSLIFPLHLFFALPVAYIIWRLTLMKLSLVIAMAINILPH
jgi:hypothetical protein